MKRYTIQQGDTLGTIAKKFYGDPMKYIDIAEANDISNPNVISIGQELVLPDLQDENTTVSSFEEAIPPGSNSLHFFTATILREIMPAATETNINKYLNPLSDELTKFEINTPLRAAHFIAQLAHESASFRASSENLNYSATALRSMFGKYFPTDQMAEEYARKPEKIANVIYANRMGNGNEASGEGWKYRGRGLIQLTGKENYTNCGRDLSLDLVSDPDQLADNPDTAVAAAGWYWDMRGLNRFADQDDVKTVTKRINGGYHGLDDRIAYLSRAKKALGI